MIRPSLTNFADYVEKPKPVILKTRVELQSDINMYLNIALFLVIIIGIYYLYQRFKYKEEREEETKQKLQDFDNYLNEYYINDMLTK